MNIHLHIYLLLFILFTNLAFAVPGPELSINTTTANIQNSPRIASDGTNYLIAWTSNKQDGDEYGIFARLYTKNGIPLTPEFQVNTYTIASQSEPQVASNGSNYLVTWKSANEYGTLAGIVGQYIDNDGALLGSPFQISNRNYSNFSSLASNGTNYMITFVYNSGGTYYLAVRIVYSSSSISTELSVMTLTGVCAGTSIASDGTNYIVSASQILPTSDPMTAKEEIYYRLLNGSSGAHLTTPRIVSTVNQAYYYDGDYEPKSHTVAFAGGRYIVAWLSNDYYSLPEEYLYNIYYRYIDLSGRRIGSEQLLNSDTDKSQYYPAICLIPYQGVIAVWQTTGYTISDILARPFKSTGESYTNEFLVNTYTIGIQRYPKVASASGSTVFIVWESINQDGDASGIFGSVFGDDDSDNDGLTYLYEIMNGLEPDNPDTDGDTLSDGDEVNIYGTNPRSDDTDNDLLRDSIEINIYGTNPNNPDSDFDGLTDWEEIVLTRTNPLDSDSDSDGLLDGEEILIYSTDPNNPDSDSDGISDYDEILSGTDPNDGLDFLAITRFHELSAYLGVDVIFIGWNSAPDKVYRVYVQTDMISPDFVLLEDNLESKGYQTFYMDQGGGPNSIPHPSMETGVRMYRVTIKQ
ncbi:MAG: hypothetical protein RBU23_02750 [Candidatus Auribacterota bacterium]|jgi:hypothetical protein|nr:hypothetical protein [Candidatus Auribacterota bacterium]